MTAHTEIALMGIRFDVCVGILPHERTTSQPLEVDVVVRHTRDAASVLDYRTLFDVVRATVEADARTYLELLAESIAGRVLAMEQVAWCRVALRKPHVALGGPLAYAQVSIERSSG